MTNPKIETDLAEILKEIHGDIKDLKKDISSVEKNISLLKTDIAVIKNNQEGFKEKLSDISTTQKNQIWSLITILAGTLISITIAYFRAK